MICHSQDAETSGILHIAQSMCVAARTAPKARGVDHIDSCYLTCDEKEALTALAVSRISRFLSAMLKMCETAPPWCSSAQAFPSGA